MNCFILINNALSFDKFDHSSRPLKFEFQRVKNAKNFTFDGFLLHIVAWRPDGFPKWSMGNSRFILDSNSVTLTNEFITTVLKKDISEVNHSWNDVVTVEDNKPLAQGLQMSSTYQLRFEVLFREDHGTNWRTLFHGTDGGSFSQSRCGGRLPGIWIRNHGPPIRHA